MGSINIGVLCSAVQIVLRKQSFWTGLIEDIESLVVSTINIYDVFKRVNHIVDDSSAIQAVALMHQELIVEVDSEIALMAGKISIYHKLPMANSLIYATAKRHDAILWTQDSDFKGLENIQFIQN